MTYEEFLFWNHYRSKYGNFNLARRIEQGVGNLFALYFNSKVDEDKRVDARTFMPHEEVPELTFEEQRMQAIKKKSG